MLLYAWTISLMENVKSTTLVTEKRLCVVIGAIQQSIEQGDFEQLNWIPSKDQLADCMSKAGVSSDHMWNIMTSGKFEYPGKM